MPDHSEMIAGMILALVLTAVAAYFCGCFNGAVIASRFILKDDVRKHGSGNAGLTNFYRVFGAKYAALVILSDVLKAVVAVLIGANLFRLSGWDPVLGKYWAALFCLLRPFHQRNPSGFPHEFSILHFPFCIQVITAPGRR